MSAMNGIPAYGGIVYFTYERMALAADAAGCRGDYDYEYTSGRIKTGGAALPKLAYQGGRDGAKRGEGGFANAYSNGWNREATRGTPGYRLKDAALAALEGFHERRARREHASVGHATLEPVDGGKPDLVGAGD